MKLHHNTNIQSFFEIWDDGMLKPMKFVGNGASSFDKEDKVIFCFAGDRYYTLSHICIEFETDLYETGKMSYINMDDELEEEVEYYVYHVILLRDCTVKRYYYDVPDIEDFLFDFTKYDSKIVYSDNFRIKVEKFLDYLSILGEVDDI